MGVSGSSAFGLIVKYGSALGQPKVLLETHSMHRVQFSLLVQAIVEASI